MFSFSVPASPMRIIVRHTGDHLSDERLKWLKELGFVPNEYLYNCYYCEAENWHLIASDNWNEPRSWGSRVYEDDVEVMLRTNGFPIERILRTKRLLALLS